MSIRRVRRYGPGFPALLAEMPGAPESIAVLGIDLAEAPYVAVVGTRRPTPYGVGAARLIAAGLARHGVVVVSGMALGIDSEAHKAALAAGGTTVAVLGCGADVCYPRRNRALYDQIVTQGSIVSEYPDGTEPLPYRFPERNRIIAGLCLGVVIVEGRDNGGAMITARLAGEIGREVFAVPGPIHSGASNGPHSLIRDGARLVRNAEEVLTDLGFLALTSEQTDAARDLLPDERRVLAALEAFPMVFDEVVARTGLPAASTAAVISRLEIEGLVARYPGSRFALPVPG